VTEHLAWALRRAREHTLSLVADVLPEHMHRQSAPGERHPAWLLGHLLLADTYLLSLLAVQPLPHDFESLLERYGPNSMPAAAVDADEKDVLVDRLTRTNSSRVARVAEMTHLDLAQPMSDAFLAQAQPTIGHHLESLVFHEGYHSGQLSSWRKAHGYAAVPWTLGVAPARVRD
jgi:DinB superfamily